MSVWISPTIPLQFRFLGSRPPELNKVWIDVMSRLSHSPRGLIVIGEDEAAGLANGEKTMAGSHE